MDFAEHVKQTLDYHHTNAAEKVRRLGLKGSDAEKLFVAGRICAYEDILAEVTSQIEKLRPSLQVEPTVAPKDVTGTEQ
jgi:hypothetical protein